MLLTNTNQTEESVLSPELTTEESAQLIKAVKPKHPALNRLHSELKNLSGTSSITSYDRMHHRHNRS